MDGSGQTEPGTWDVEGPAGYVIPVHTLPTGVHPSPPARDLVLHSVHNTDDDDDIYL